MGLLTQPLPHPSNLAVLKYNQSDTFNRNYSNISRTALFPAFAEAAPKSVLMDLAV